MSHSNIFCWIIGRNGNISEQLKVLKRNTSYFFSFPHRTIDKSKHSPQFLNRKRQPTWEFWFFRQIGLLVLTWDSCSWPVCGVFQKHLLEACQSHLLPLTDSCVTLLDGTDNEFNHFFLKRKNACIACVSSRIESSRTVPYRWLNILQIIIRISVSKTVGITGTQSDS